MRGSTWIVLGLLLVACKKEREVAPAPAPTARPMQMPDPEAPCPLPSLFPQPGGTCTCSTPVNRTASVWGTGQYTDDSAICTAALHAGVIGEGGGKVTITFTPGCGSYRGSTRNGIETRGYGGWNRSYVFGDTASAVCDQTLVERTAEAEPASAPPVQLPALPEAAPPCPAVLPVVADGTADRIRCRCSVPIPSGPIWGTGPYTLDSSPCAAAVHAGAIPVSGGVVELHVVAGCARYEGGAANGLTSHAAGRSDHAFAIGASTACKP